MPTIPAITGPEWMPMRICRNGLQILHQEQEMGALFESVYRLLPLFGRPKAHWGQERGRPH